MVKKLAILCCTILISSLQIWSATPVELYGHLGVDSNNIVDQNGEPVQLRGMSMFWSQWGSTYYKKSTIDWLTEDWKISIIRAAMGVESGGYLTTAAKQKALVDTVVQAAIANGIYVIIDWHDHNADEHTTDAKTFFEEMAQAYKDYPNIIYEIYNEPDQTPVITTWAAVKSYADTLIQAIRAIDSSNLIVVGTPNWCQSVHNAASSPITGYKNIAYSLHFYAASHKTLRSRAVTASKKIPLFVTEWGTCAADGNGMIDLQETKEWLHLMDTNNISWCNWSINSKAESASALKTGAKPSGNWADTNLRESGTLLRAVLRGYAGVEELDSNIFIHKFDTLPLPGRLEVEKFASYLGIQVEDTEDDDGVENIGYIENGDWATYSVKIAEAGNFYVNARIASDSVGGSIGFYIDNSLKTTLTVPVTGGWQTWKSIGSSETITLDTGLHTIKLTFKGVDDASLFNVNWIELGTEQVSVFVKTKQRNNLNIVQNRSGVHIALPINHGMSSLEIIDANGRIFSRRALTLTEQSVQTGKLKNGFYILRLKGINTIVRPIIINQQ